MVIPYIYGPGHTYLQDHLSCYGSLQHLCSSEQSFLKVIIQMSKTDSSPYTCLPFVGAPCRIHCLRRPRSVPDLSYSADGIKQNLSYSYCIVIYLVSSIFCIIYVTSDTYFLLHCFSNFVILTYCIIYWMSCAIWLHYLSSLSLSKKANPDINK